MGKAKNRNKKVKEEWSNCGELGKGGFGVVHKQIQKATSHYRAVKMINKRLPAKIDYSRELLVMAILAKVCSLTPREFATACYPVEYSFCGLMMKCFSIHRYL